MIACQQLLKSKVSSTIKSKEDTFKSKELVPDGIKAMNFIGTKDNITDPLTMGLAVISRKGDGKMKKQRPWW